LSPFRLWFGIFSIFKIITFAKHCDIIHSSSYGGAIPSFIGAKILRKKCVFMVYEFMGGIWGNLKLNRFVALFYQIVEKIIANLPFDKFISISRYTRNCLRLFGIPDNKLEIAYGGKDSEIFHNSENLLEVQK